MGRWFDVSYKKQNQDNKSYLGLIGPSDWIRTSGKASFAKRQIEISRGRWSMYPIKNKTKITKVTLVLLVRVTGFEPAAS